MELQDEVQRLEAQGQHPVIATEQDEEGSVFMKRFGAYSNQQGGMPPKVNIHVQPGYPQARPMPLHQDQYGRFGAEQSNLPYGAQAMPVPLSGQGYRPS